MQFARLEAQTANLEAPRSADTSVTNSSSAPKHSQSVKATPRNPQPKLQALGNVNSGICNSHRLCNLSEPELRGSFEVSMPSSDISSFYITRQPCNSHNLQTVNLQILDLEPDSFTGLDLDLAHLGGTVAWQPPASRPSLRDEFFKHTPQ